MKALVYFPNDPSVGIWSTYYTLEIPQFDNEFREEYRKKIKDLYEDMDSEFICIVYFGDEDVIA